MWVQAATTMSTYQAAAEAAQAGGGGGGQGGGGGSFQLPTPAEIWQMIFGPDGEQFPNQGQPNWDPSQYLQNLPNLLQGNQQALVWLQQNWQGLTDPSQFPQLISYFIAWQTFRAVNWTLRTLRFMVQELPLLLSAVLSLAVVNLGATVGLATLTAPAGLAGLSGLAQPAATPAVNAPFAPAAPITVPAHVIANSPVVSTAPAAATTSIPLPTPSVAATNPWPPAPQAPPPPPADSQGFGYLVGVGYLGSRGQTRTISKAEEHGSAIAAVVPKALSAPPAARSRRQLRPVIDRGYRYEFLDDDNQLGAEPTAPVPEPSAPSDRDAGPLGFAGTASSVIGRAAGLATLSGDDFDAGPKMPMLPGTWDPETPEREGS
jgi:PPE-repeat protein